jgi:Cu-processing system permease protein
MNSLFAIAKYTLIEQIRNRLYLIILFFGGIILLSSLLLGSLAPGHKVRVIFDLGLLALELFGLATAVFGSVTLILQEIESKTIYLIITRPIRRSTYILGRFFGLVAAVAIAMGTMAVLHVLIMLSDPVAFKEFADGWSFWTIYPSLVLMSACKMLITSAVAIFFSLFATSSVSALVFTACFWIGGHFGPEMSFLLKEAPKGFLRSAIKGVLNLLPNFQFLNFRDTYAIPGFPGFEFMQWGLLYTIGYSLFFLALSAYLFSRKEF